MGKIENIELIRAKNAFEACKDTSISGKAGGEVVKKLPPMIRENGLLGALAFAIAGENKTIGYKKALDAIARHLNAREKVESNDASALLEELIKADDSLKLRDATAEAMLYLNYLRRFAKKD
ncbi:MAG: type III-B CRISPR module-associated protein Cmr5 [Lentisphaeria bacterium]|nr:type III-B CRISPR module-associated protein Cmr5 [Lentisphaeria bacterium]